MSLVHWIWLTQQVGNAALAGELAAAFGKPERVYAADEKMLLDTGLVKPEMAKRLAAMHSLDAAQAVLRDCAESDIRPITLDDALYPERLRNIPDPPLVLYSRGAIPLFDDLLCIAVVGTRKASERSRRLTEDFAAELASRGVCVISGMAAGIDSAAHTGALRAGGLTTAVFGCGADICYPAENRSLMEDILRNGCILTEYAPGTQPSRTTFPRRNRIMAGLAVGVLVSAAPERSGSLITAHLASDYGRDVFVIPGGIQDAEFRGANALLRQGAMPVTKVSDILEEYEKLYRFAQRVMTGYRLPQSPRGAVESSMEKAPAPKPGRAAKTPSGAAKKSAERLTAQPSEPPMAKTAKKPAEKPSEPPKTASKNDSDVGSPVLTAPVAGDIAEDERVLLELLKNGCEYPDQCVMKSGMSVDRVLVLLTKLEIAGRVKHLPGGRYQAL